jgi:hypothetical protein
MTAEQEKALLQAFNKTRALSEETHRALDLLFEVLFAEKPEVRDRMLDTLNAEQPFDTDAARVNSDVRNWLKG